MIARLSMCSNIWLGRSSKRVRCYKQGHFKDVPLRYMVLDFTENHTIRHSMSFRWYDDEEPKRFLIFLGAGNAHTTQLLPKLGSKAMRHSR